MFTPAEKELLYKSIDMQIASIKRAKNTQKLPQFTEIYDKMISDLNLLTDKIRNTKEK